MASPVVVVSSNDTRKINIQLLDPHNRQCSTQIKYAANELIATTKMLK